MDGIRAWGLRIVASVLAVGGVLAFVSAVSTGRVQFQYRQGRSAIQLAGFGAIGVSLFIVGVGAIAFLSSFPPERAPRGLRSAAIALLIAGGLLAGFQFIRGLAA